MMNRKKMCPQKKQGKHARMSDMKRHKNRTKQELYTEK